MARAPSKRCSFCGKSRDIVKKMLEGPAKVRICDQCVRNCEGLIAEDERIGAAAAEVPLTLRDAYIYLTQHAKVLRAVSGSDAQHVEELAQSVFRISEQLTPKQLETIAVPAPSSEERTL